MCSWDGDPFGTHLLPLKSVLVKAQEIVYIHNSVTEPTLLDIEISESLVIFQ
jgi:hypothetical protein